MLELLKKLEELRCSLLSRDSDILKLAEDCGPDMLQAVAGCLVGCATSIDGICKSTVYKLSDKEKQEFESFCKNKKEESGEIEEKSEKVTPEDLEAVAALAEEFSKSSDQLLRRQASVLDQVLLTFAVPGARESEKSAYDSKIAQIKEELKNPKQQQIKKSFKADEMAKAVDQAVKEYSPLEAPLKTRSCIDHPGHQLVRVSDDVYECSLDKKRYDYKNGYTTLRGNKVPGGDIALQSQMAYQQYANMPTSFNVKK